MKVLIIDDEPLIRKSLSRVMFAKNHQIFESENGKEGLAKWQEVQPDLVFLDVLMPILSGPQVLKEVPPEVLGKTKVILMSAYSASHNLDSALKMGADLFLAKPFEDIFSVANIAEELVSGNERRK